MLFVLISLITIFIYFTKVYLIVQNFLFNTECLKHVYPTRVSKIDVFKIQLEFQIKNVALEHMTKTINF